MGKRFALGGPTRQIVEEFVFVAASVEATGELLEAAIEHLNHRGFARGVIGNRVFAFTRNVRQGGLITPF